MVEFNIQHFSRLTFPGTLNKNGQRQLLTIEAVAGIRVGARDSIVYAVLFDILHTHRFNNSRKISKLSMQVERERVK